VPGTAISARRPSSTDPNGAQAGARQTKAQSLFGAIEQNDSESVKHLLAQGVDVNQKDEDGYTPLMKAVRSHKEGFVRLLLKNGADARVKASNGDTALHLACKAEDPTIVELLVSRARRESGEMLLQASREGKKKSVKLLLSGGVDVNFRDEHGNTPLMIASGRGRLAVIEALLDHGADIHAVNNQGITALGWAYSPELTGQLPFRVGREVVRMLKQHGAKSTASFRPR
jgi:ankyrin repeat protein